MGGDFTNVCTLGKVSFSLRLNRMRTLLNRGKTKGSALVGILNKVCRPSYKLVGIGKGRMGVSKIPTTETGNVNVVRRRVMLIPCLAITRGLFLKERVEAELKALSRTRVGHETTSVVSTLKIGVGTRAMIRGLAVTRRRVMRVMGTMSFGKGVVIVSRPASSLSGRRIRRLFKVVRGLEGGGMDVVCVSREVRRLFQVSSQVAIVESKACMKAGGATRAGTGRLMTVVIKESLSGFCMESCYSIRRTPVTLRMGGLSHRKAFRSVDFSIRGNRVLKFTKLMNTKEDRVVRTIFKTEPCSTNRVFVGKSRIRFGGPVRTVGSKVTLIPRSEGGRKLMLKGDITFGLALSDLHFYVGKVTVDRGGHSSVVRRCDGELEVGTTSPRVRTNDLSNKGRRGIMLKG